MTNSGSPKASPQVLAEIDCVCDEFEREWTTEASNQIETFLQRVPRKFRPLLFRELLLIDLQQRLLRQDAIPSPQDISARFSTFQDVICAVFREMEEQDRSETGNRTEASSILKDSRASGVRETIRQPEGKGHSSAKSRGATGLVADYELLDRLGQGGMGVVYRARHRTTNRIVALKVIRGGLPTDDDESRRALLERFKQEAMAAARVEHDHIVTVYDAGEADGLHFHAMQLVDGEDLSAKTARGPLAGKAAATYLVGVARAVHAAHEKGILHRDLKPHNILVDAVSDRALVTDFGLAKLLSDDCRTRTGEVFGSPSYMAPEQAVDASGVTVASDVYALGATLYHLITGRPPFVAATAVETIRQVHEEEPVRPRLLNSNIDRDLETIALKCLDKDPTRRYASCDELADELESYLEDKPIRARPISFTSRVIRWSKRNRLLAATSAATVLALVLGTAASTVFAIRANYNAMQANTNASFWRLETRRADRLADLAEQRRQEVAAALYESLVTNAKLLIEQRSEHGWSWKALDSLRQANEVRPADANLVEMRSLLTAAWTAKDLRRVGTVARGLDAAALAFSPDGESLVVGQRKNNAGFSIQLYDSETLELEQRFNVRAEDLSSMVSGIFKSLQGEKWIQDGVSALAFSHDSRWLFAGTRRGEILVWELGSEQQRYAWTVFDQPVREIVVSPHEYRVFAISAHKNPTVTGFHWQGESWSEVPLAIEEALGHTVSNKHSVHVTATPTHLARSTESTLRDAKVMSTPGVVTMIDFDPSGLIVAGLHGLTIRFFDIQSEGEIYSLELPVREHHLYALDFSSGGELLAATGKDPVVHLVDYGSAAALPPLPTPGRDVPIVCFPRHAPRMAVAAHERVDVHQLRTTSIVNRTAFSAGQIEDVAISPDGRTVFTTSRVSFGSHIDYQLSVWNMPSGQLISKYHCFVAADSASKPARIDVDGPQLSIGIPGVGYDVLDIADLRKLESDEKESNVANESSRHNLADRVVRTARDLFRLDDDGIKRHEGRSNWIAITDRGGWARLGKDKDGNLIAHADDDTVWRNVTGKLEDWQEYARDASPETPANPGLMTPAAGLLFDSRDRWLAPKSLTTQGAEFDVDALAMSASQDTCAAVVGKDMLVNWIPGENELITAWNNRSSTILTGMSRLMAIDAYGGSLLVGRRDGMCMVSSIRSIDEPQIAALTNSEITAVALNENAGAIATNSGELKICQLPELSIKQEVDAFETAATSVAISESGNLIAAGSSDGTLCLWHLRENGQYDEMLRVDLGRPIDKLCLDAAGDMLLVQLQGAFMAQSWNLRLLEAHLEEFGLASSIFVRPILRD